jgi:HJR/Mrr/RecB family endonuclease
MSTLINIIIFLLIPESTRGYGLLLGLISICLFIIFTIINWISNFLKRHKEAQRNKLVNYISSIKTNAKELAKKNDITNNHNLIILSNQSYDKKDYQSALELITIAQTINPNDYDTFYIQVLVENTILKNLIDHQAIKQNAIKRFLETNSLINNYMPNQIKCGELFFFKKCLNNDISFLETLISDSCNHIKISNILDYINTKFLYKNSNNIIQNIPFLKKIYTNTDKENFIRLVIKKFQINEIEGANPYFHEIVSCAINDILFHSLPSSNLNQEQQLKEISDLIILCFKKQKIEYIDNLNGKEFEDYFSDFFQDQGYKVLNTPSSGDYGADLIISINKLKIAIQCKRYSSTVGIAAVQEIIAAKKFYKCNRTVVITNSFFSKNAIELAKSSKVLLIDRNLLLKLINKEKDLLELF